MDTIFYLELAVKCAVLFVLGSFSFDIVHYILHVFETSRFRFLRWLGGFHSVHHEFLDREMQIQRRYTKENLFLHVIPEYMTAVIGMSILGYLFFGWLPALLVTALRTVMVIIYLFQKGEDYTHQSMTRINGKRSLFFVGPHYHALHHVYPYQYYSSFVNVFDLIFGTNCQLKGRKFLILGDNPFSQQLKQELESEGGSITLEPSLNPSDELVSQTDTLIIAHPESRQPLSDGFISSLKEVGKSRLLPPEVWMFDFSPEHTKASEEIKKIRSYYSDQDMAYKYVTTSGWLSPANSARLSLFFIKRGLRYVPLSFSGVFLIDYLFFLLTPKQA